MQLIAEHLSKHYLRKTGSANHFLAVQPLELTLEEGTLTALTGRSGSGKTTLLQLLAGLLSPSSGRVIAGETDLYSLSDEALSRFRNQHIGVIPQGHAAVSSLTVLENVLLPGQLYGNRSDPTRGQALLERLGMAPLADASPSELSGGEMRRMSIARALAAQPELLPADEPTGDLDDENTQLVLHLLREIADQGTTVLLVTHEEAALPYADRILRMDAGRLTEEAREI